MDVHSSSAMNEVNVLAKLADVKEDVYHQLLLLSALTQLLVDKGLLTREEIAEKQRELDQFILPPQYPKV